MNCSKMKSIVCLFFAFLLAVNFVFAVETRSQSKAKENQLPCKCLAKVSSRIVHGRELDSNKYPWQVFLFKNGTNFTIGSGVILNEDFILTAGSMLPDPDNKEQVASLQVKIPGLHHLHSAEKVIIDRLYERTDFEAKFDIGLIKLKNRLDFNTMKTAEPACLDLNLTSHYQGHLRFAGWGSTSKVNVNKTSGMMDNFKPSDRLKEGIAEDMTSTDEACKGRENDLICAVNNKREDAFCLGDSGAPLHRNVNKHNYVVGILGLPHPEFKEDNETVVLCNKVNKATRLSYYSSWIKFKINSSRFCTNQ